MMCLVIKCVKVTELGRWYCWKHAAQATSQGWHMAWAAPADGMLNSEPRVQCFSEAGSHYVAQADLQFSAQVVFPPQPPKKQTICVLHHAQLDTIEKLPHQYGMPKFTGFYFPTPTSVTRKYLQTDLTRHGISQHISLKPFRVFLSLALNVLPKPKITFYLLYVA